MDHFARLGLPAALEFDSGALDRAYFAAQRQWHPDRFVGRPAEERPQKMVPNGPCHCGSGKKYKKCCAGSDAAA